MPRGGHDIPVSGTHLKGTQWLRRVDPTVGHLKGTPWSRRVWTPQGVLLGPVACRAPDLGRVGHIRPLCLEQPRSGTIPDLGPEKL